MSALGDVIYNAIVGLGVSSSLVIGGVKLMPQTHDTTQDFFEVHAIEATRSGDKAALRVSRTIHQPIEMQATVRVMERGTAGWRQYCLAEGPTVQYRPEAEMPGTVTLAWWTWGKCPDLPEGDAQVWTTWTPQRFGLAPLSYVLDIPDTQPE